MPLDRVNRKSRGYYIKTEQDRKLRMAKGSILKIRGSLEVYVRLSAVFLILLPLSAFAAFGFKMDGSLDKEAISHAYFEGDFHRILPPLEAFRNSRAQKTKDDSIFVFKYLSVIYAADSSTRPKAESYMVQLVKMKPTIELIDLYISDNIEAIFTGVKENYLKQQQYIREHDLIGNKKKDSETPTPKAVSGKKEKSSKWIWWTTGGVGVAAVVAIGYYAHYDDPAKDEVKGFKP